MHVAPTNLPIGYYVIVPLKGLSIGYSVIVPPTDLNQEL